MPTDRPNPWTATPARIFACARCDHRWQSKLPGGPKKCDGCQSRQWRAPMPKRVARHCLRCGYRWQGYAAKRTACCPACKSFRWGTRAKAKYRRKDCR